MRKIEQIIDGKGIELVPYKGGFELLELICCDCKLVHRIAFAVEDNGNLGICMKRNVAATRAARRKYRVSAKPVAGR